MAFKLVVLAAFVAATSASGISTPLAAPVAVAKAVIAEPYDPNPQYSYGYEVQDPLTGDSHGQVETRSGDVVQGSYALLDSDGTRRVVDYTADPVNGFNAVVSKQPLAVPAIAKVAAPVAVPAPVLRAAPIAPAPVLRAAPLAPAPVFRTAPFAPAPVLRAAPFAPAPVPVPSPLLRAAPLAPAPVPFAAPLLRSAPIAPAPYVAAPLPSTTIVSGSPVPLLRAAPLLKSTPLANVW